MSELITATMASGKELWFGSFRGTVLEQARLSETDVRSAASFRNGIGGSSASLETYSEQTRTHEIWLRSSDGKEREVELPTHGFSVRAGHEVTMFWGAAQGNDSGCYVAAVNHTTNTVWHWPVGSDAPDDCIRAFKLKRSGMDFFLVWLGWTFVWFLAAILVGAISGFGAGLGGAASLCGPAEIGGYVVAAILAVRRCFADLRELEGIFAGLPQRADSIKSHFKASVL